MVPQPASQATLANGTVLSKRYRIEETIGSGGYATVYRATDLTFGYERAIKEVSDPDPGVRTQFRLEAELLINSKHPNIPRGYHILEDMGRLYLVMDYVHGKDLEELLNESLVQRKQPLDEAQVLRWAIDICDALDETHNLRSPVIHRDIKPANIKIMPDGKPVLIDFGLAKLQQRGGPTRTAAQGVSPGFAPPEQYLAKGRTDARTDIYGLGATLYACLTGKDPPEAPSRLLTQAGAGGGSAGILVNPRRLNPRVSEETDHIIVKALELSANNRQQSAKQLREELLTSLQKLTGVTREQTLTMGVVCARCGTQNRPEAIRCANCAALLRAPEGLTRATGTPAPAEGSGKRPAINLPNAARPAGPGVAAAGTIAAAAMAAERGTGRQVAVGGRNAGASPAAGLGEAKAAATMEQQRSAKQAAVQAPAAQMGQPAPVSQRSGKQRAVAPGMGVAAPSSQGLAGAGALATGAATAVAVATARGAAIEPLPAKAPREVSATAQAVERQERAPAGRARAWIRLGAQAITGFDKVMLALAAIEALWGAVVLGLGVVSITSGGNLPVPQLVAGWLAVVVLGSILGAQALIRPIFRRGNLTRLRRWLQGAIITLYSIAVQGAGVWGAYTFLHSQSTPLVAIISYIAFGVSALGAGIVGIITILG